MGIIVEKDGTILEEMSSNASKNWALKIMMSCLYIFSLENIKKTNWIIFNKFVMTRIQILPELVNIYWSCLNWLLREKNDANIDSWSQKIRFAFMFIGSEFFVEIDDIVLEKISSEARIIETHEILVCWKAIFDWVRGTRERNKCKCLEKRKIIETYLEVGKIGKLLNEWKIVKLFSENILRNKKL